MLVIEDTWRDLERAAGDDRASEGELGPRARRRHSTRRGPVLAMAAGLLVAGLASLSLLHEAGAGTRPPVPAASPGMVMAGPADVAVQMATYEPAQSSGWHAHTGMHAVMVLSGTLTFYDGECRRQAYGPGESYVGGQGIHLAKNETAAPVEVAVTYLFPAGVDHTRFHVPTPAPVGCATT